MRPNRVTAVVDPVFRVTPRAMVVDVPSNGVNRHMLPAPRAFRSVGPPNESRASDMALTRLCNSFTSGERREPGSTDRVHAPVARARKDVRRSGPRARRSRTRLGAQFEGRVDSGFGDAPHEVGDQLELFVAVVRAHVLEPGLHTPELGRDRGYA